MAFLPGNFESASSIDDLVQLPETATIKTLFRIEQIPHSDITSKAQRPPYIHNNAYEWIAPTLFVSSAVILDNKISISLALNVLANYITDFFKGTGENHEVKLDIVVETTKTGSFKKLSYQGNVDGLKELHDIVKEVGNE